MTSPLSLLDRALASERWYRDGLPSWPNAPTQLHAIKEREKSVKRLRKHGTQEALLLADRLGACGERTRRGEGRCLSSACFECSRALQRWSVAQTLALLEKLARTPEIKLYAVHLVPVSGTQLALDLSPSVVANHHRRVRHALARVGIDGPIIGAFDVSFNTFEGDYLPACWQVHHHLLVLTDDAELPVARLKRLFPATDFIAQPISVQPHDGSAYGLSYLVKPTYWRKLYFADRHRPPRIFELKPAKHVELLVQLDRLTLRHRLFLRAVRIRETRQGIILRAITMSGKANQHGDYDDCDRINAFANGACLLPSGAVLNRKVGKSGFR